MRETFTSGSVGRAPGNRRFYPEPDREELGSVSCKVIGAAGYLNRSGDCVAGIAALTSSSALSRRLAPEQGTRPDWSRRLVRRLRLLPSQRAQRVSDAIVVYRFEVK